MAALCVGYMAYLKYAEGVSMILTPLPILAALLVLVGVLSTLMGLVAEILVRTYFESQERTIYIVGNRINFD
jgi:dolichol-phosphate mannosyltransferase